MSSLPPDHELLASLRLWCKGEQLTQSALEQITGIPQATLSRWLKGSTRRLGAENREILADSIPLTYLKRVQRADAPRTGELRRGGARLRVFLSSTYRANAERRRRILDAIERTGMQPVKMETWTASDRPALRKCLDELDERVRAALQMQFGQNARREQVAQELKMSLDGVKSAVGCTHVQ